MVSLEVGLARVMQFMFGGFSLCMLYSAETMFGPKSPGGAMIYWNTTMGPMGDWFARALGCVSISILLGTYFNLHPPCSCTSTTTQLLLLHVPLAFGRY